MTEAFNIKKVRTVGQCLAMRCKAGASDLLCSKHEDAWRAAGSPPLTVGTTRAKTVDGEGREVPGVDLAVKPQMDTERGSAQQALQLISDLPITCQSDLDLFGVVIGKAQTKIKELEGQRTSVTKPLLDIKRQIDGWFKPVTDTYKAVVTAAKDRVITYQAEQKAAKDAALAEIEAGGGEASAEAFAVAHAPLELPANLSERKVLKFRVLDISAVPTRHLIVDDRSVLAEGEAGREVPGIEFYHESALTGRGT